VTLRNIHYFEDSCYSGYFQWPLVRYTITSAEPLLPAPFKRALITPDSLYMDERIMMPFSDAN